MIFIYFTPHDLCYVSHELSVFNLVVSSMIQRGHHSGILLVWGKEITLTLYVTSLPLFLIDDTLAYVEDRSLMPIGIDVCNKVI